MTSLAAHVESSQPHIVLLDYITLMAHEPGWEGAGQLSAGLKMLSQQFQLPVLAAAQLNRSAAVGGRGDFVPGPEALSISDAIGQDADAVITMRKMSERVVQMKMAKYRHGRDGYNLWCRFDPDKGVFNEVSRDKAVDLRDEDEGGA